MRAYGLELRKRAWEALEEGETSEEVGERFGIDPSCVRKWRKRVRKTGNLLPGGEKTGRKREFDASYERALMVAVQAEPDAIRRELSEAVGKQLGRVFSEPVIGRALRRLVLSRKKNSTRQRAADLSPIEPCWSKVKELIRAAAARTVEALDEAIVKALRAVSTADARGWFGHCGYRVPARLSAPSG